MIKVGIVEVVVCGIHIALIVERAAWEHVAVEVKPTRRPLGGGDEFGDSRILGFGFKIERFLPRPFEIFNFVCRYSGLVNGAAFVDVLRLSPGRSGIVELGCVIGFNCVEIHLGRLTGRGRIAGRECRWIEMLFEEAIDDESLVRRQLLVHRADR